MNSRLLLTAFIPAAVTMAVAGNLGQSVPEMPDLDYQDNTMILTDIYPDKNTEAETFQLRCGFYDESNPDSLTLYVCIGELYEYEGGPFYSDDLYDTFVIRVTLPADSVGAPVTIDGQDITADYYDIYTHSWKFNATTGTLTVIPGDDHVYDVEVRAMDLERYTALGAHICRKEAWRWRDYNEERPNPNQFDLKKGGQVKAHHDILSCVVDDTDSQLPVFYFADQPDLESIDDITALDPAQYVRIQMPVSLMDGMIKGFSGWSDDSMTVTYNGYDYNHSNCLHDETCYGGNVQMVEYDTDSHHIIINSTIYTMIFEDYCNMSLHYEGPYVVNGSVDAISQTSVAQPSASTTIFFDLCGRRVQHPTSRSFIFTIDGQKIVESK